MLSWLSLYHPPPAMGICTPLLSCVDSLHHKSLLLFLVFIKKRKHQTEHSWETLRIFHHLLALLHARNCHPFYLFLKNRCSVCMCVHTCVCVFLNMPGHTCGQRTTLRSCNIGFPRTELGNHVFHVGRKCLHPLSHCTCPPSILK